MPDIRPVRIEPDLYQIISDLATKESRSITKQVNYLLRMGLSADSNHQQMKAKQ